MAEKTDREAEKAEKAATKELAAAYKTWVAAIKSKDALQIALLEEHVNDDTFLFAAGGFSAFAKGATFKDPNSRAATLRLIAAAVTERSEREGLDDVNVPAERLVRRALAFLEAAKAVGAGMAGAETLVAAASDTEARIQEYGLRALRAVVSSVLSTPQSDHRREFVKECLLSERLISELTSLVRSGVAADVMSGVSGPASSPPTPDAPLASASRSKGKERVPSVPSGAALLEASRLLYLITGAMFSPSGTHAVACGDGDEDAYSSPQFRARGSLAGLSRHRGAPSVLHAVYDQIRRPEEEVAGEAAAMAPSATAEVRVSDHLIAELVQLALRLTSVSIDTTSGVNAKGFAHRALLRCCGARMLGDLSWTVVPHCAPAAASTACAAALEAEFDYACSAATQCLSSAAVLVQSVMYRFCVDQAAVAAASKEGGSAPVQGAAAVGGSTAPVDAALKGGGKGAATVSSFSIPTVAQGVPTATPPVTVPAAVFLALPPLPPALMAAAQCALRAGMQALAAGEASVQGCRRAELVRSGLVPPARAAAADGDAPTDPTSSGPFAVLRELYCASAVSLETLHRLLLSRLRTEAHAAAEPGAAHLGDAAPERGKAFAGLDSYVSSSPAWIAAVDAAAALLRLPHHREKNACVRSLAAFLCVAGTVSGDLKALACASDALARAVALLGHAACSPSTRDALQWAVHNLVLVARLSGAWQQPPPGGDGPGTGSCTLEQTCPSGALGIRWKCAPQAPSRGGVGGPLLDAVLDQLPGVLAQIDPTADVFAPLGASPPSAAASAGRRCAALDGAVAFAAQQRVLVETGGVLNTQLPCLTSAIDPRVLGTDGGSGARVGAAVTAFFDERRARAAADGDMDDTVAPGFDVGPASPSLTAPVRVAAASGKAGGGPTAATTPATSAPLLLPLHAPLQPGAVPLVAAGAGRVSGSSVLPAALVASRLAGPWLSPSDAMALLCLGYGPLTAPPPPPGTTIADAAAAAQPAPDKKSVAKALPGAGGAASTLALLAPTTAAAAAYFVSHDCPFAAVQSSPLRLPTLQLCESVPVWPAPSPSPAFTRCAVDAAAATETAARFAAAVDAPVASKAATAAVVPAASAPKPVAPVASKSKDASKDKGAADASAAPAVAARVPVHLFPPSSATPAESVAPPDWDGRLRGLRLLQALLLAGRDAFSSPDIAVLLSRLLVDAAAVLHPLAAAAARTLPCMLVAGTVVANSASSPPPAIRKNPGAMAAAPLSEPPNQVLPRAADEAEQQPNYADDAAARDLATDGGVSEAVARHRGDLDEAVARACVCLSFLLSTDASARTVEALSSLGPIVWDSILALALPVPLLRCGLPSAGALLDKLAGRQRSSNDAAEEGAAVVPFFDPATWRSYAPARHPAAVVHRSECCLELLRRAALQDARHRTADASRPAAPAPVADPSEDASATGGPGTAPASAAGAGGLAASASSGKLASGGAAAAAAGVKTGSQAGAKDRKSGGGGSGSQAAALAASASAPPRPPVTPALSHTAGGAVLGIDWDVLSESPASRLGSMLLRHAPILLACLSQRCQEALAGPVRCSSETLRIAALPAGALPSGQLSAGGGGDGHVDVLLIPPGPALFRCALLRTLQSVLTVHRARDRLALEQLRCVAELTAAHALAAVAEGAQASVWGEVAAQLKRSRVDGGTVAGGGGGPGLFLYGTHGCLVLGCSRSLLPNITVTAGEDSDALSGAAAAVAAVASPRGVAVASSPAALGKRDGAGSASGSSAAAAAAGAMRSASAAASAAAQLASAASTAAAAAGSSGDAAAPRVLSVHPAEVWCGGVTVSAASALVSFARLPVSCHAVERAAWIGATEGLIVVQPQPAGAASPAGASFATGAPIAGIAGSAGSAVVAWRAASDVAAALQPPAPVVPGASAPPPAPKGSSSSGALPPSPAGSASKPSSAGPPVAPAPAALGKAPSAATLGGAAVLDDPPNNAAVWLGDVLTGALPQRLCVPSVAALRLAASAAVAAAAAPLDGCGGDEPTAAPTMVVAALPRALSSAPLLALARALVPDVRDMDPSPARRPPSAYGPALTEASLCALFAAVCGALLQPLVAIAGFETSVLPAAPELSLAAACIARLCSDFHRGVASQSAAAVLACAAAVAGGAAVQLEALRAPFAPLVAHSPAAWPQPSAAATEDTGLLLAAAAVSAGTCARDLAVAAGVTAGWLRDQMQLRMLVWGRRLASLTRPLTEDEAAALEAASAAPAASRLVQSASVSMLPSGISSVDVAGRVVVEELLAGRDDPLLVRWLGPGPGGSGSADSPAESSVTVAPVATGSHRWGGLLPARRWPTAAGVGSCSNSSLLLLPVATTAAASSRVAPPAATAALCAATRWGALLSGSAACRRFCSPPHGGAPVAVSPLQAALLCGGGEDEEGADDRVAAYVAARADPSVQQQQASSSSSSPPALQQQHQLQSLLLPPPLMLAAALGNVAAVAALAPLSSSSSSSSSGSGGGVWDGDPCLKFACVAASQAGLNAAAAAEYGCGSDAETAVIACRSAWHHAAAALAHHPPSSQPAAEPAPVLVLADAERVLGCLRALAAAGCCDMAQGDALGDTAAHWLCAGTVLLRGPRVQLRSVPLLQCALLPEAAPPLAACLRVLAAAGCDLNARNGAGLAPLHAALACGRLGAATALLEAGASPVAPDGAGRSPLLYACLGRGSGGGGGSGAACRMLEQLARACVFRSAPPPLPLPAAPHVAAAAAASSRFDAAIRAALSDGHAQPAADGTHSDATAAAPRSRQQQQQRPRRLASLSEVLRCADERAADGSTLASVLETGRFRREEEGDPAAAAVTATLPVDVLCHWASRAGGDHLALAGQHRMRCVADDADAASGLAVAVCAPAGAPVLALIGDWRALATGAKAAERARRVALRATLDALLAEGRPAAALLAGAPQSRKRPPASDSAVKHLQPAAVSCSAAEPLVAALDELAGAWSARAAAACVRVSR